MVEKLIELITEREDRELIRELLQYDWLRCGHRFLPDCLGVYEAIENHQQIKGFLYGRLPEEIAGLYRKGTRNHFFKKSFFLQMSVSGLQETGFSVVGRKGYVCFLLEREKDLYKFNKAVLF